MNPLIKALNDYQERAGLTTCELANKLGLHFATLYRLKSGERTPGAKVLRAIVRHLPELKGEAFISLSNNHPPKPHQTPPGGQEGGLRGKVVAMAKRIFSRPLSKAGIFHLFSPFKRQG